MASLDFISQLMSGRLLCQLMTVRQQLIQRVHAFKTFISVVLFDQLAHYEQSVHSHSNEQSIQYHLDHPSHPVLQVQACLEVHSDGHSQKPPESDLYSAIYSRLSLDLLTLRANSHDSQHQEQSPTASHKIFYYQQIINQSLSRSPEGILQHPPVSLSGQLGVSQHIFILRVESIESYQLKPFLKLAHEFLHDVLAISDSIYPAVITVRLIRDVFSPKQGYFDLAALNYLVKLLKLILQVHRNSHSTLSRIEDNQLVVSFCSQKRTVQEAGQQPVGPLGEFGIDRDQQAFGTLREELQGCQ